MRTGHSVLLIACVLTFCVESSSSLTSHRPQCPPSAIGHLCRECDVKTLFFDNVYLELAKAAQRHMKLESNEWELHLEPLTDVEEIMDTTNAGAALPRNQPVNEFTIKPVSEDDTAYLHHTSGTSTGTPKPIPQSHKAAIGVLPRFNNGQKKATFTTTPLYHGGIADCFRAWTSGAMIWLFPGSDVPITASNVIKCLKLPRKRGMPEVSYFSSVPYVLQMMAAEDEGIDCLKGMELVGVGGAALPEMVGNKLVREGINLVSRFGSAECGFLLSSHRYYETDANWQYLRNHESPHLKFEEREEGLDELVVLPTWPHIAKPNRADGSYATSDLFEAHSFIRNAYRYSSRADSQLTLVTGKKFDPAPLEAAMAASPLVADVLVFGNERPYPGALIFRSPVAADMTKEDILNALWPSIERFNAESQAHTRLSRSMLMIMPKEIPVLPKSSKGTIMRGQADRTYARDIDRAYSGRPRSPKDGPLHGDTEPVVSDEDVAIAILNIVKDVIHAQEAIPENTDLFSFGVDSVASVEIRSLIHNKLLPDKPNSLPFNVVYDCGTIKNLARYIINTRHGKATKATNTEDEMNLMRSLVDHYSLFPLTNELNSPRQTIVVLTGATGALGAHILAGLLASSQVSIVHCLVRAASQMAAVERVSKALRARKKLGLNVDSPRICCHPCKLSESKLGLEEELYSSLAVHATVIIHAAWAVNFSMRLSSFKDQLAGLENLIDFANFPKPHPPRFLFCSSTASMLGDHTKSPIPESISHDPHSASPLGYSRSKWVAEAICEKAYLRTPLRGNIAVLRIGQLCGDTENGIWNASEAWPLMLSSVKVLKALPDLNQNLDWLPADTAAQAVIEIALNKTDELTGTTEENIPVYHILNPSRATTWSDLLGWMQRLSSGFAVISPAAWVSRLKNLQENHPCTKLLGLWMEAYGEDKGSMEANEDVVFDTEKTKGVTTVMSNVKPIDEAQFEKMWRWIEQEMV